jgi:pimeloyl-ACP methyl ester carboxylesterase
MKVDLMLLNFASFGAEIGVPLVIVHGLFGAARNWRALARNLAKDRWVVTVDMRNHGQSFWDTDNSYAVMAEDLAQLIAHLGGKADVLGHSMGGKASMVLALTSADAIRNLIIADIAPVKYTHTQSKNIAIMREAPIDRMTRRSEAQAYLQDTLGEPTLAAFLSQNLVFEDCGPRWQINLQALDENMDAIIGFPSLDVSFSGPTMAIRGGNSTYVTAAGQAELARLFPNLTVSTLEGTGHWLHAEKPHEFIEMVDGFLKSHP